MLENVTFENLNDGELPKRFAREFNRVLENIADERKTKDAKRTIVLEIDITPSLTGETASTTVRSKSKLQPDINKGGMIRLEERGGELQALAIVDEQTSLFEIEE